MRKEGRTQCKDWRTGGEWKAGFPLGENILQKTLNDSSDAGLSFIPQRELVRDFPGRSRRGERNCGFSRGCGRERMTVSPFAIGKIYCGKG